MIERKLSVSDKLIIAAYRLTASGKSPFTAEDLVISAWQNYPDTFGLSGHVDENGRNAYPDSNRVFAEIMGTKPVRQRGYLVKVGNKLYRLTEVGTQYASQIQSDSTGIEKLSLARPLKDELHRLLHANAVEKFRNGQIDDITFHDACGFWKISSRSTAIEFTGRYNNIERLLSSAKAISQDRDTALRHGGNAITLSDVESMLNVHHLMRERFSQEIEVILRRTDER
jgi:hypothetical protein